MNGIKYYVCIDKHGYPIGEPCLHKEIKGRYNLQPQADLSNALRGKEEVVEFNDLETAAEYAVLQEEAARKENSR
ncbi:hypothetical protein [Acinetobacter sp.]|uniref:hypothetical protein n=1 Tax=Acinetobacter sp. TaxID=472 RepID=UPI003D069FA0